MKTAYLVADSKNLKSELVGIKMKAPKLIITSPPYFDVINYNNNKNQIGFGQKNYEDYLSSVCDIFQQCYDVSASDATLWVVVDSCKRKNEIKLLPFDIISKLRSRGSSWILNDIIIWDKGKNLPFPSKGSFKSQHEYILFFTKKNKFKFKLDRVREVVDLKKWWKTYPERYNPNGKAPSSVWNYTPPLRGWGDNTQNHFCPFPFPLVEKIISLCSDENDWILDPFAGSGSVLAIAKEMKRNSVGLDVNSTYKKRFQKEVIPGAALYWKNRSKELSDGKKLTSHFKNTNRKLRKLKVANNICKHLNTVNRHPFIYYAKDLPQNVMELTVLQNGVVPKISLKNEKLSSLIKQSNIELKLKIKADTKFVKNLKGKSSYKYRLDKFYSNSGLCKMQNVLGYKNKYDYIYSNMEIDVS